MNTPVRKDDLRHFETILSAYADELAAARGNAVARKLRGLVERAGNAISEVLEAWPSDWPEVIDRHAGPVQWKGEGH